MTSTLISEIDARLKAGARAVMRKKRVAAGVDMGTDSTKAALVGVQGGRPVIHNLIDEEGAPSAATASIANERADMRACGLSGHEVRTFRLELPPMPMRELEVLIRRSIAQSLRTEPEVAFETAPGAEGKIEILAIASSEERISSAFGALNRSGIAADAAYADVTALAECVKAAYPGTDTRATCIFNMGATWSELVLLENGRLVFSRSIKMGLSNLIETTADLCGMSKEEAQDLIFSSGADVTFQEADEHDLNARAYAESVRDVIEQVVVEVHRSLSFASIRHGLPYPEVVLLCGGASLVPGMASALGRDTGTRVEVFDPLDYLQRGDDVDSGLNGSLFCVAIGLALLALRPGSPAFEAAESPGKPGIERHVTTVLLLAAVALAAVFVTGRALDSTADRYEDAVSTENLVLESLSSWLTDAAAGDVPELQSRAVAYSLLNEPSPVWQDVIREASNVIPEGIVLEHMSFTRADMASGEVSEWTMAATGVVTDVDNTAALLRHVEEALETSLLFRDVEVLPQGSVAYTYRGRKIPGAIRFELGAKLE